MTLIVPEGIAQVKKAPLHLKVLPLLEVVCHLLSPQLQDGELLRRSLEKLALPNVFFDLAALCLNSQPETYPYETARGYVRG